MTLRADTFRIDHRLTADELRVKYFDPAGAWDSEGEHPLFSKWDWYQIVAQRSTLLGYWEHVVHKVEEAYYEED